MNLERQHTSPLDQAPFGRQATSPFDVLEDGSFRDDSGLKANMRLLADKKVELTLPTMKILLSLNSPFSLIISSGGIDGVRVGERLEVTDWAIDPKTGLPAGISVSFNGKICSCGGSISVKVDSTAPKKANRFQQNLSSACGGPLQSLLDSMAKFAGEDSLGLWKVHTLAQSLTPTFTFKSPPS